MDNPSNVYLLSGILNFVLLFVSAIVSVLGSIWIVSFLTRKHIKEKKEIIQRHNIAPAMILGAFIWTIGNMCLQTIKPIMNIWYSHVIGGVTMPQGLLFPLAIIGIIFIALVLGPLVTFLALGIIIIVTSVTLKAGLLFSFGVLVSLLVALTTGAMVVFMALKLLLVITRDIDEWAEIKHGNIAVAVVISVTVIVVGMFFESTVSDITLSLFNSLKLF